MDLGFSESTDHDYPNWLIGFGFLERERERESKEKGKRRKEGDGIVVVEEEDGVVIIISVVFVLLEQLLGPSSAHTGREGGVRSGSDSGRRSVRDDVPVRGQVVGAAAGLQVHPQEETAVPPRLRGRVA